MKPRIKSIIWSIRKKNNIQSEQREEKIIKKTKTRIGKAASGTTSNVPTFKS